MILIIFTHIISFMSGFVLANLAIRIAKKIKSEKFNIECVSQFECVLENLKSGKSSFFSRVNNTVIIKTSDKKNEAIDAIYLIDKKMVCIFKNNACLYTSDNIGTLLKENIILNINNIYKKEIEDIIELFGVVISKKELHEKFEELKGKISKGEIKIDEGEESYIEKIIGKSPSEDLYLDIDQILDKISEVGLDRLSSEEKEFLNNFNKK
jgi:hypothetical protein